MSELQRKVKGFSVQGFCAPNVGGVPRALVDARELFQEAGLGFPTIPRQLASLWKKHDDWLYSTRPDRTISPYDLGYHTSEAEGAEVEDHALLAHSGHSFNSYAIQYYLVLGPLRLFLFLGWGGVYMNPTAASALIGRCFSKADEIAVAADKCPKLRNGGRLTVVASDSYDSYWEAPGRRKSRRFDATADEVLVAALAWLKRHASKQAHGPLRRASSTPA